MASLLSILLLLLAFTSSFQSGLAERWNTHFNFLHCSCSYMIYSHILPVYQWVRVLFHSVYHWFLFNYLQLCFCVVFVLIFGTYNVIDAFVLAIYLLFHFWVPFILFLVLCNFGYMLIFMVFFMWVFLKLPLQMSQKQHFDGTINYILPSLSEKLEWVHVYLCTRMNAITFSMWISRWVYVNDCVRIMPLNKPNSIFIHIIIFCWYNHDIFWAAILIQQPEGIKEKGDQPGNCHTIAAFCSFQ